MNVAFCGLGSMGRPMAGRLLEAGHGVAVWNRTPERARTLTEQGATVAPTPAEAARTAEVVVTMLADAEALEAVVFGPDGIEAGIRPGSVLVEMSTVGPDAVRSLAARLPAGVDLLDAPVKGGPAQAEAGELVILAGGSRESFERCEPLLEAMGQPRHVGPTGTGAASKVLNNYAVIPLVSLLGEAAALGERLGLSEELTLEVLSGTPLSATLERWWDRASPETPPSFRLRLAAKDLGLAIESARTSGLKLRLGEAAASWLREADGRGLGDRDQASVIGAIRGSGRES